MKNITISKANPSDAKGIQMLTVESSKGMYELCGWSSKEIEDHFPPEKNKEGAERLRKNIPTFTEDDILFVAKDADDKVVGCCFANRQVNKNTIEAVYVLPEYQGLGLAKELYDRACEYLNPNNDTYLDAFSLNSKAINFYKKQGFSETGKKTFDDRFIGSTGEKLEITEMRKIGVK
ncbi:MAG: GNAT family N-acetyltransferase [bacterium]